MNKYVLGGLAVAIFTALSGCSDPCENVVCVNGGICVDGNCECPEGWQGADCSQPLSLPESGCGDLTSVNFDDHEYEVVSLGNQCWFAENLQSDQYRNGDFIPGDFDDEQWQNTTSGAQALYCNDESNLSIHGRLYNLYAVQDNRGLCPAGWHVPSDEEWKELELYLGMTQLDADEFLWRGTDQGEQMKVSPTDVPSWDGSNSCGFKGLPSGFRDYLGPYESIGSFGYWWCRLDSGLNPLTRGLGSTASTVYRFYDLSQNGLSVRCVKD
jgi:uncharacterized protein (TIGR02145 family)